MPASESAIQSHGTPECYRLTDGRYVEIRNGCVVDPKTRETLAGSEEAGDFILAHGKLQEWERELITYWKRDGWRNAGGPTQIGSVTKRQWKYQTQKEREAA